MKKTALVLGVTGGVGGEVAKSFAAHGWKVRVMMRNPAKARVPYEVVTGDVMNRHDVLSAAQGVSVIAHCVNPSGYRDWDKLIIPMLENTIAAAESVGATVLYPASAYVYGKGQEGRFSEGAPQKPTTSKGRLRYRMERLLEGSRAAAIVVRAGDFIGPNAGSSWFSQAVVKPGKPLKRIVYPGRADKGHAWAYLPDLAETMVRLVERRSELERYSVFNFRGYDFDRGIGFAHAVQRAAGDERIPISGFPLWALRLIAPFHQTIGGIVEMSYLWRQTIVLDNRKLVAFLGEEPHTPVEDALRTTMRQLGCLPQSPAPFTTERVPL